MIIGNSEIMNTWHEEAYLHLDLDPQNLLEGYFILEAKYNSATFFFFFNFRIPRMRHFSLTVDKGLFLPCILPQTALPMLSSTIQKSLLLSSIPYGLIPS